MPTAFGSDRCSGGSVVGVHAAKETENGRGFNQLAETFIARSISNATRRTYGETVKEFFAFVRNMQPTEVTSEHVIAYRDRLIGNRKSANTVALKLSIIRSFYEYLGAEGFSNRNPASTKLVSPPPCKRHAVRTGFDAERSAENATFCQNTKPQPRTRFQPLRITTYNRPFLMNFGNGKIELQLDL